MKTRQVWTPYRDEILRKRYPKEGASAALCGFLGANRKAVQNRAITRLGLKVLESCPHWTNKRNSILRRQYPKEGASNRLCSLLKTTRSGIFTQAYKLGLEKTEFWTTEKDAFLRRMYGLHDGLKKARKELGCSMSYIYSRACHLGLKKTRSGAFSKDWKGCGEVSGKYMNGVKSNAGTRGLDFEINAQIVWRLFEKQNKLCALTGIPISFADKTASVDRIDSARGYLVDNIQITHKTANRLKQDMTDAEFRHWCSLVVKHLPAPVPAATESNSQN